MSGQLSYVRYSDSVEQVADREQETFEKIVASMTRESESVEQP